jgi:hypothetical protein
VDLPRAHRNGDSQLGLFCRKKISMHVDHEIFVEAIRNKRKVELTFLSNEDGDKKDKLCGPIFYSASVTGKDSGCYYLRDFDSDSGNHFLGLLPSQIVSTELTEEPFDLVEFFTSPREISDSRLESGGNLPNTKRKELDGKSL